MKSKLYQYDKTIKMMKKYLNGLTFEEIANQYGVTRQAVQSRLSDVGVTLTFKKDMVDKLKVKNPTYFKEPKSINPQKRYDWSKVDWGKKTNEIRDELGCNYGTVSKCRKKFAPDTIRPIEHDWKDVLLNTKPSEQIIVTSHLHAQKLRTAAYSLGWKIKQRKSNSTITIDIIKG